MKMKGNGRSIVLIGILATVASADNVVIDMRDDKEVKPKTMTDVKNNFKNESAENNAVKLEKLKNSPLKMEDVKYSGKVLRPAPIKIISTKDKALGAILSEVGEKEDKIYILRGLDFVIKDEYEVRSIEELEKVVEINSNYRLVTEPTGIESTNIARLVQKEKEKTISLEARVDLLGLKRILLTEFNVKLVISKSVMDAKKTDIAHIYGDYTLEELIEDLEEQYNLWFVLKDDKLYAKEEKEISFDVKRIGEFGVDFAMKSASSTGADAAGDDAATGFSYKVGDENGEKFLENLKTNFPTVRFKDSYSGFVSASVKPREFKEVTDFFNNIEKRHELINGEITLLNLKKNDGMNFESNWSNLLLNQNLLSMGSNGTLFFNNVSTNPKVKLDVPMDMSPGTKIGVGSTGVAGTSRANASLGIFEALQSLGEVSVVDKWTIATATGIPTGFTNYDKTPYFTQESSILASVAPVDPANPAAASAGVTFKIHYALTGFKATFKVNKTAKRSYIIDGAIDYSTIFTFKKANEESSAPQIQGKSMRIYTEFDSLDKTIVIGGFKNLKKEAKTNQTPFLGNIPLIGWLFKNVYDSDEEGEFILLIKLNEPTMLDGKEARKKFTDLKAMDKAGFAGREEVSVSKLEEKAADDKRFDIFE